MRRMGWMAIGAAAALAACSPPTTGQIESNAYNAEQGVEDDAETRAENLDRLSNELTDAARGANATDAAALRNEAAADRADAADTVADGDNAVDAIKTREDAAIAADARK